MKSQGAKLSFSSVSVRKENACALSPISPFLSLLAGLAALRAANRRQIRETLEKPRSKAQLFGRFCASGMRRGFFLPGKTVARRGQAARNSRVRARRGEEKDTVRDLPGAAALEKAKEQSSAFRAFLCVGDAPGLSPCPGKQELSAGTHPERTACVRGSNADTNTVRVLPTAGARACETRGRKRHSARLARRRRAAGRLSSPLGRKPPADKGNARKAKEQSSAFQAFLCKGERLRPFADLPLFLAAGRLSGPSGRKPPADKGNARKAKEQSSAFQAFLCVTYSRRYPAICQQTDADPETGCMEFDIEKGRFSFRLTAPYSEERRQAASEAAKAAASNLTRRMV